jgi:hypothetical protein
MCLSLRSVAISLGENNDLWMVKRSHSLSKRINQRLPGEVLNIFKIPVIASAAQQSLADRSMSYR